MRELVRLRMRLSRNGKTFTYLLEYVDENGRKRCKSLGHSDKKKAEKQKKNMELELRAGVVGPRSMKLSAFLEDSLDRTGQQIRESTLSDYRASMEQFIDVIGDIDYQKVTLAHGELFRQTQLDKGNTPATVSKKVRALKRFFELAVRRRQLDENVLKYLDQPKWGEGKVEVYKTDECERLLSVAHRNCGSITWDLLIYTALCTGMRRAELLNLVWADVDFDAQEIHVTPKQNTAETWRWLIKDTDSRDLPLTDDLVAMLAEHQAAQPDR